MLAVCKTVWVDIYNMQKIEYVDLLHHAIKNNIACVPILNRIKCTGLNTEQVTTRKKMFTEDDSQKLLDAARATSPMDALSVELMLTTGLRIGSLSRMKWCHVDHDHNCMYALEKGNKVRPIALHSSLRIAFELQRESQKRDTEFVFTSNRHNRDVPLTTRWLRERFYILGSKALPGMKIYPHMCRHTVVHRLFECNNSLTHIARFLGHSSTTTTTQYYLKYSLQQLIQQMNIPWLSFKEVACIHQTPSHKNAQRRSTAEKVQACETE